MQFETETPLNKAEREAKEAQEKFEEDFKRVDEMGEETPAEGKDEEI